MDVERTTYGFTSNAYTTRVNPANINIDIAIHCDSVRMTVKNVVGSSPISDSIGVVILYDNVDFLKDTNEIFLFDKALVKIHHGGQVYTCNLGSSLLEVDRGDTTKVLRFNLHPCLTGLGITLVQGDSVNFYGDFVVNPNGPIKDNFRKVPNLRSYGFATINGVEYACDNYGENFTVAKIPTVFSTPGGNSFPRGCSTTPFAYSLVTKNIGFGNEYPNEFYPAISVDSFVLNYDTLFLSTFQNPKVEVSFPGHPVHGNAFFVINPLSASDHGHYVARFDTLVRVPSYNAVQSYSFNLRISVNPTCESQTGSAAGNNNFKMNPSIYYTDREFAKYFGDGSCAKDVQETRTQNLTYSEPPKMNFQAVSNPNLLLAGDTAEWTVNQCNTSLVSDAGVTWFAARMDTSALEIVALDLVDNPASVVSLPFQYFAGGTKIFANTPGVLKQAGANTPAQICNTIRIRAIPKKCGTFPLQLETGWNCVPYTDPTWTPDEYAPCKYDSLQLQLTTLNPLVDATIINQPAAYPSLCDTVETEMLVRNTGQGVLLDVLTRFSIPLEGATLVPGGVSIAYPSNAPYVQVTADPVLIGTTTKGHFYQYENFDSLSQYLAENGLAGFDPLNPTLSNEYKIKYKFTTDCNFKGGVLNYYSYSGQKVCREKSNVKTGESFPIYFTGLEPPTTKSFETSIGNASYFANNDTSLIEIVAQNLLSTPTDAFDKISIKLPEGISYIPNSSIAIEPSTWTIAEPEVIVQNGITILSWRMPAGIGLNGFAKLRFNVVAPPLVCDEGLEIAVSTLRETDYLCPNGTLACSLDVITSSAEDFINVGVGQNGNFAGADRTICPGATLQLSALHPDYVAYQWSPASGLNDATIPTPIAAPDSTTTYSVVAFDANGCSFLDELTITVAGNIQVSPVISNETCSLGNGTIALNATGLDAGATYQWNPNVSSSSTAAGLSAGLYQVTITNSLNGCSATVEDIVELSSTAINVTTTSSPASNLQPNGGSISLNITNGTPDYSIAWSGQSTGNATSTSSLHLIPNLSAGNYQITITSSSGCSAVVSATISQDFINNLDFLVQTMPDNSCCAASGGMTVQGSGGNGVYTIKLTPDAGSITPVGNNNFQINGLPAGSYTVSIEDVSGLSSDETVIIIDGCVLDPIQQGSFAGPDVLICKGETTQLSALHSNFVSYQWLPGAGLNTTTGANPVAAPSTTTTYTVSAFDANGCEYTDQVLVTVADSITITPVVNPETCQTSNGAIILSVTGATSGGVSYTWQPNVSTSGTASGLSSGIYQVTVSDVGSGCTSAKTINLLALGAPISVLTSSTSATNLQPNGGSIAIQINGGIPPFSISWTGTSTGMASSSTNNYVIPNLSAGDYQIVVTSAVGCTAQVVATVQLEQINNLTLLAQSQGDTSCCFSAGAINIQASGGDGNYTISWSPQIGNLFNAGIGQFTITGVEAGMYVISVTDGSGLTQSTSVNVADGCICGEIFEEEVIYEPSGVEGICIGIPYIFFNDYPILVNGVQYTGPIHSCDIDTVVYYAFSFLNGNGFDGPFLLEQWECNDVTISNVEFYDLYDLVDSMNVWDPYGYWVLDDYEAVIYGGDLLQSIYGSMKIHHPATNTPFDVMVNYTGFSYGTEIFVNPFDGKVVVSAYDSLTCCSDSVCVIFVNPCDELIPYEPYIISEAAPSICLPLQFADVNDYYIFIDQNRYFLPQSCDNGNGIQLNISGALGFHELIVIDTVRWCSDTVPMFLLHSLPAPAVVDLSTTSNTAIENICPDGSELWGSDISMSICGEPMHGVLTVQGNCVTYLPDAGFVGNDNFCLTLCDENGICDTTYYNARMDSLILIHTTPDTVDLIVPFETQSDEICLSLSELGCCVTSSGLTCSPMHGVVSFISNCLVYTPDDLYIGNDTACAILCNGNGVCDTTYLFITVLPPTTPGTTIDTLHFTTPYETPLPEFCLDLTEIDDDFEAFSWCSSPSHGIFSINENCIEYMPVPGYIGADTACAIVCNTAGVCDTTYIFFTILPPVTHGPTIDTLHFTTPYETPLPEFCLDLTEIDDDFEAFSWCSSPSHGIFSINENCIEYTPVPGYSGADTACAIVCNTAGVCDTTYIFFTILPPVTHGPTIDTLHFTTPYETPLPEFCLDLTEIDDDFEAFSWCSSPSHGIFSINGNCIEYTPVPGYFGADTACAIVCNTAGVCDTTYIFFTILPPVTPGPTIDTLYFITPYETTLPEFCLDLTELGGSFTSINWCMAPEMGTTSIDSVCITYTPSSGFVGTELACIVLCNDAGVCDTTFISITVLPEVIPADDCNFFGNDTVVVEMLPGALYGQVCIGNLPLDQAPLYQWFDNGQVLTNAWVGCDFDTCIYMSYFAIPNQGGAGPYIVNSWIVNGVTHSGSFSDIQALQDSMNTWDYTGNWIIDQGTFTLQNCSQNNAQYSIMEVTQPATGGHAFLSFQNRFTPNGTSILLTAGPHILTVIGPDCVDTLWAQIVPSHNVLIDTFIYLNTPTDTLCLSEYGINIAGVTNTALLCQDHNGTNAIMNYDTLTGCVYYQGISIGQDTLCLKLNYGTDSCTYVTFLLTVLEPLNCNNFISADTISGVLSSCLGGDSLLLCIDVPYAIHQEFEITLQGQPTATAPCVSATLPVPATGIIVHQAGAYTIVFNRIALGCSDTIYANVSCRPVLYDTLQVGVTDTTCIDISQVTGNIVSFTNACTNLSGAYIDFVLDTLNHCVSYTALTATGTDTACVVICTDAGACDTTLLIVTAIPADTTPIDTLILPIAVNDFDTMYTNNSMLIPVLNNDTLNGIFTSLFILVPPLHGIATVQDVLIDYEPLDNYCDSIPDSLQYILCNQYGCDTAWVYINLHCEEFMIFDGFSPNTDDMNDYFHINGLDQLPDNDLQIFNRWGNQVYFAKPYRNDWAGTWNGTMLPDGVYFYLFKDGKGKTYSGSLTIQR